MSPLAVEGTQEVGFVIVALKSASGTIGYLQSDPQVLP
jgi:hypothetical protein